MISLQNKIVIFIVGVISATCSAQLSFGTCPPVHPMQNINASGILGVWHEIEHSINVYDRYESCISMNYSMAEKNAIKVDHRSLDVFNGGYLYFTVLLHPYINNSLAVYRMELERYADPTDTLEIVLDTDYDNYEVKVICDITREPGLLAGVINSRRTTLSSEHMLHAYNVLRKNSIEISSMQRIYQERCPNLWRFRLDVGGQ